MLLFLCILQPYEAKHILLQSLLKFYSSVQQNNSYSNKCNTVALKIAGVKYKILFFNVYSFLNIYFNCFKLLPAWSCFSCVQLFATLWTIAQQTPLSMGFSRQEYWSGLPYPPSADFPDPGIEPMSFMSPELADVFFTIGTTWKPKHAHAKQAQMPHLRSVTIVRLHLTDNRTFSLLSELYKKLIKERLVTSTQWVFTPTLLRSPGYIFI